MIKGGGEGEDSSLGLREEMRERRWSVVREEVKERRWLGVREEVRERIVVWD